VQQHFVQKLDVQEDQGWVDGLVVVAAPDEVARLSLGVGIVVVLGSLLGWHERGGWK